MPDRAWEELIAEGRQLDRKEGELRFAWGDWALKVAPMGTDTANNGSAQALRRAMAEAAVSVSYDTMREFRRVADRWPLARRLASASWSVHQDLAAHPDRFSLVQPGMTVDQARRLVGAPRHRPSDAAGKAAVIREHLKDPAVVKAIAADNEATSVLWRAGGQVRQTVEREAEQAQRERLPGLVEMGDFYTAKNLLHQARFRVRLALRHLQQIEELGDDGREAILEDAETLQVALEWLFSFVRSGSRSFEDELAKLLAQEES